MPLPSLNHLTTNSLLRASFDLGPANCQRSFKSSAPELLATEIATCLGLTDCEIDRFRTETVGLLSKYAGSSDRSPCSIATRKNALAFTSS